MVGKRKVRSTDLAAAMQSDNLAGQTWLMVNPHDDDLPVGAGLWIQAAVEAGRLARSAGRIPLRLYAQASSPVAGRIAL